MLVKVFFLLAFQGSISGYIEKSNPYIIGQLRNATFTLSANENAPLHTTGIPAVTTTQTITNWYTYSNYNSDYYYTYS